MTASNLSVTFPFNNACRMRKAELSIQYSSRFAWSVCSCYFTCGRRLILDKRHLDESSLCKGFIKTGHNVISTYNSSKILKHSGFYAIKQHGFPNRNCLVCIYHLAQLERAYTQNLRLHPSFYVSTLCAGWSDSFTILRVCINDSSSCKGIHHTCIASYYYSNTMQIAVYLSRVFSC